MRSHLPEDQTGKREGASFRAVNPASAAAQTYTYDSFGNIVATTGSLTNSFRYTGREFDTETSLYYYRARYYDPQSGRFISEDPIGFDGGDVNVYRYSFNNPIVLVDPSGLTVTCYYNQVSGRLSCTDDSSRKEVVNTVGYSGGDKGRCPECVNDPYLQGVHDQGPIPVGNYSISPGFPWEGMPNVMKLTPLPGSSKPAFDRSPGLLFHGDLKNGPPRSASKGCIIVDPLSRQVISQSGGGTLHVFNPDPFFTGYPRRTTPFQ
ncbi:MAG: RHS repeat-associated core domain-containing protein [Candidatus Acidiferrum sp.]